MFTKLLVPTDFNPPSDAALAYARAFAGATGASLDLLHVAENTFLRPVVSDPYYLEGAARQRLAERLSAQDCERLHATGTVERSDEPADGIIRYARNSHIDLIVMGTHGRSGLAHVLIGSVAERVVRAAPCPVLTVRSGAPTEGETTMFTRILVPTDFSGPSDAALEYARILAAKFGASMHLVHVLEEQFITAGTEMLIPEPGAMAAAIAGARERLSHRLSASDQSRLNGTSEVIVGSGARTIVEYADRNGYDLIVMGTHGRTGLAHVVMGSVAEHVVRTAPCPVLTVRALLEPAMLAAASRVAVAAVS